MFMSTAYAQAATGAPPASSALIQFVPLVFIFIIMYLLMIRPQQKRFKDHRAKITAIKRGDEVVTGGGLVGKVAKVTDDEVEVEIAKGITVRAVKTTIADVRGRPVPMAANDPKA